MKMDTYLFWGVCRKVKFFFGGTREGLILIWGYAIIKRLRTPVIGRIWGKSKNSLWLIILQTPGALGGNPQHTTAQWLRITDLQTASVPPTPDFITQARLRITGLVEIIQYCQIKVHISFWLLI
jgi:hypothetical protein